MSIASEFDSTIENIKSDYEGLENIGADLTNIDKNIYNIRTCLDNIYTNLPKTTGEGSNLSLTTLKGRINVDDILGDTEQDTTTGKNLLENIFTTETLANGIKIEIIEDKKIKISGTASAVGSSYKTLTTPITLTANTTYTFSVGTKQSGYGIYLQNSSGTSLYYLSVSSTTPYITFTPTEDVVVGRITLHFPENNTINTTIYLQLEKGSSATSYEIFTNGASPNPTYPQDINVVTGTQDILINGTNIYDSSYRTPDNSILCAGGTCTEANGVFTIQANRNDMYVWNVQSGGSTYSAYQNQLINFTENTYTITLTNALFTKNFITFFDADKKSLNYKQFNTNSFTFTKGQDSSVPSTAKYFTLRFGMQESVSGTTYTTSVQIEVGSTATPYTPYQEQTKTLHLGDIELAKIGTYQDRIFETSGKNLFGGTLYNGQVGSQGSWVSSTNRITNINADGVVGELFLEKGTYTISMPNLDLCSALTKNASGTILDNFANSWNSLPFTFTLTQDGYLSFTGRKNDNSNITASNFVVMLNEGSTALPYEPYGSDKWYIEKNIGKVNLKDISWTYENVANRIYGAIGNGFIRQTDTTALGYLLCTHYTNVVFNTLYRDQTITGIGNGNGGANVTLRNTNYTSLAQYTTEFTNNTEILYYAKTPTYEEITNETLINELNELEKMMSYSGQTNISVSGNLPMILDVSALKGE